MTSAPAIEDALLGAVLRMRRVSGPEAPFPGWLARVDDSVVQLVDTAHLRGWPGWRSRGEHILAVQDVVRLSAADEGADDARLGEDGGGGHEAVLPWCVERVDTFLARRSAGGAELSAGEVITIVVSLLRGCGAARGTILNGAWWLTQDGTPVFVCDSDAGDSGDTIGHAAASIVERVAQSRIVTTPWRLDEIARVLRADDDSGDAEAHLFAIAPPEPLVLAPLIPRRAADARRAGSIEIVEPERRASALGRLLRRHVDSGIGEMVSDVLEAVRRGTKRARGRVARPWLVAAGIAGVIVVGGLAWPTSTAPPANARPVASDSPATPSPDAVASDVPTADAETADAVTSNASGSDGAGEVASDDPVRALEAALDILGSCADESCGAELFEDPPSPQLPSGAVALPSADRKVELLDDLGGVAILSVTGVDGTVPAQLVVLVRTDERWVIRDVRDVEGS